MIAVVYSSVLIAVLFTPIESKPQEPIKVMNFSKVMQKLKKRSNRPKFNLITLHLNGRFSKINEPEVPLAWGCSGPVWALFFYILEN